MSILTARQPNRVDTGTTQIMNRTYFGRLPENDPLHGYLQHDIQPQITGVSARSTYRVFGLNGSNDVYQYEDHNSGARLIGKFFLSSRKKDAERAVSHLTKEFNNLCMMRDYELTGYPGVEETIRHLHPNYHLAIITDAQTAYAIPELHAVGLSDYFDPIIVSGNFGDRKPDERLFASPLADMKTNASEVVYVGNDMYRDVYGAQEKEGVKPDYIIYSFPELLNAIRFFENQQG